MQLKVRSKKQFDNPIIVIDNAPPYTSQRLEKHFRILRLPPKSPELNPIQTINGICAGLAQIHNLFKNTTYNKSSFHYNPFFKKITNRNKNEKKMQLCIL